MANTFFKTFAESDRTSSRTLLHESIPIAQQMLSGTYAYSDSTGYANVKSFSHGMLQSVYDYPYLSSSANHIFDMTWGFLSGNAEVTSAGEGSTVVNAIATQHDKKRNMYAQMAQILNGFDINGKHLPFDFDGNFNSKDDPMGACTFISFSRLLVKDEIKKGSFTIQIGSHNTYATPHNTTITLGDYGAEDSYKVNSPAGEYGLLYTSPGATSARGLVFYQAGIVVLPITHNDAFGDLDNQEWLPDGTKRIDVLKTGTIDQFCKGLLNRIKNIQFNNTTELNSTIYFCRASHNEFNYSSNTTYVSGSKILVKSNRIDSPPRAYVTTVGLYSADNELLAVAKLSEPLRKDPTNELTLRVRLDY